MSALRTKRKKKESLEKLLTTVKHIYKNKKYAVEMKKKILKICTLPVLCYGGQDWSLIMFQTVELKVILGAMKRCVISVKKKESEER